MKNQALNDVNFLLALDKHSMYKLPSSPVADWEGTFRKPRGAGLEKVAESVSISANMGWCCNR